MSASRDRLELLLVEEATGSLTKRDRAELDALLVEYPDVDRYAFERAAASVFLAAARPTNVPLPKALYRQIQATSERLSRRS